ncbi:MAG: ATP-binding protein [Candidatus Euphemobacter frigidus]|nr:ATP-binding protein [Candidatus Euphemobacter frigidus]MDP8276146.1 ATP-binding protein [Candidatus Euphemobacter frigidus]
MKPGEEKKIRVPARLENLEKLIDFTLSCLRSAGIEGETASDIHLAVDEACTNCISYTYPSGSPGDIELTCTLSERSFVATVRDWGITFNPLKVGPPDLNLDIDRRPVGGLGVYLMKKFSDRLEYRRENGSNLLTIIKMLD